MSRIALLLMLLAPAIAAQEDGESEIEVGGKPDPKDAPDPADKPLDREPIPARAADAKVEWVAVPSANKLVTLHVPSDWRVREIPGKEDQVAFEAMVPGGRVPAVLDVRSVPGTPPAWTLVRDQVAFARKRDERAALSAKPRPNARVDGFGEDPKSTLCIALRIRGNGFFLRMESLRGDYDCFAHDLFGVAERLETSLPDWPVVPENYTVRKKGAFLYAVHPSAGASLKELQKIAARTEKWFTKFHGKPPRDSVPPVLFLHQNHGQGVALWPKLAEAKTVGTTDFSGQRAFFREFKADEAAERASVARRIAELCFVRRYQTLDPAWARVGVHELAAMIEFGGMKPPKLHIGYREWIARASIPSLKDLNRVPSGELSQEGVYQSAYYALLLHYGPSSYRGKFKHFLEACAETGDIDGALDNHLAPIGFDKLLEACDGFRRSKVEYVAPK